MNYTLYRFVAERDKESLLAFWNRNHEEHLDKRYEWLYENNPAGKAIGLLIKDKEHDTCIGCSAAHPRRFAFMGASLRGMIARDFFVDEKHRILGPALTLMRGLISTLEENEVDFIYGYPNKKAEPVMRRAGFTCLGSWTRMVRLMGVRRRLPNRHLPHCLSRLISLVFRIALRLFALETWYRSRGGFTFEEIATFDERFKTLWKESQSRSQMIGERTSEYCTWRFLECPNTKYMIFAMFDSHGAGLKGYIISCIDDGNVDIRDFVFPKGRKAIRVLLTCFLRHVRKASPESVVVTFLENETYRSLFKRYGFIERAYDRKVYCYFTERTRRRFPGMKDPRNWLLLSGDVHY